ncbi:MAG: hypothetical protein VW378_04190 [bacterium]
MLSHTISPPDISGSTPTEVDRESPVSIPDLLRTPTRQTQLSSTLKRSGIKCGITAVFTGLSILVKSGPVRPITSMLYHGYTGLKDCRRSLLFCETSLKANPPPDNKQQLVLSSAKNIAAKRIRNKKIAMVAASILLTIGTACSPAIGLCAYTAFTLLEVSCQVKSDSSDFLKAEKAKIQLHSHMLTDDIPHNEDEDLYKDEDVYQYVYDQLTRSDLSTENRDIFLPLYLDLGEPMHDYALKRMTQALSVDTLASEQTANITFCAQLKYGDHPSEDDILVTKAHIAGVNSLNDAERTQYSAITSSFTHYLKNAVALFVGAYAEMDLPS